MRAYISVLACTCDESMTYQGFVLYGSAAINDIAGLNRRLAEQGGSVLRVFDQIRSTRRGAQYPGTKTIQVDTEIKEVIIAEHVSFCFDGPILVVYDRRDGTASYFMQQVVFGTYRPISGTATPRMIAIYQGIQKMYADQAVQPMVEDLQYQMERYVETGRREVGGVWNAVILISVSVAVSMVAGAYMVHAANKQEIATVGAVFTQEIATIKQTDSHKDSKLVEFLQQMDANNKKQAALNEERYNQQLIFNEEQRNAIRKLSEKQQDNEARMTSMQSHIYGPGTYIEGGEAVAKKNVYSDFVNKEVAKKNAAADIPNKGGASAAAEGAIVVPSWDVLQWTGAVVFTLVILTIIGCILWCVWDTYKHYGRPHIQAGLAVSTRYVKRNL
jgi:hypothetical protein